MIELLLTMSFHNFIVEKKEKQLISGKSFVDGNFTKKDKKCTTRLAELALIYPVWVISQTNLPHHSRNFIVKKYKFVFFKFFFNRNWHRHDEFKH